MTLTPTNLTALAIVVLAALYLAHRDDPRAWEWVKTQWRRTVDVVSFTHRRLRRGVER